MITYVAMDNKKKSYISYPTEVEVNKNLEGQIFKNAKFDEDGNLKEIIFQNGTILALKSDMPDVPVVVDSIFRSD